MKKRKSKKPLKKEDLAEDYCFVCKDGGDLVICDYKSCLKAYHLNCIGKDESFLNSKQTWHCYRHYCFVCKKASEFQCYYCPKAVCLRCIYGSEFVNFKGKYGFCRICLKVVLLLEEGKDADSDGGKVDFNDYQTMECLFKEYYEIHKKESFSVDALLAAKERLRAGKNLLTQSDSGEFDDTEDESLNSDSVSLDNVIDCKPTPKKKEHKAKLSAAKSKHGKSKSLQFCGWGSKPLVKFLKEMGRDTEQKMSRFEVTSLINRYIKEQHLYHPVTKKNIVCDEKLCSIFGKKILKSNRIHDLLGAHFAENLVLEDSSEEENYFEDDDLVQDCAMRKESKSVKARPRKEAQITVPPSTHASISKHNINLVYLRKSLVQELLKHPASFEGKIIGSFVRVKADPNDFWQKNSHQLVQVTGVKQVSTTGDKSEINLCVTNMLKEISISLLSEGDFSEEEVEDLWQRMKDGLIQQPTVVELQKKANDLHQDITKDWIVRELKKLDIQIDLANEKGWRRELYEYLERKKRLQLHSEQSRLLETYPTVIPEAAAGEEEEEEEAGDEGENNEASPPRSNDKLQGNQTSEEEHIPAETNTPRQTQTATQQEPSLVAKQQEVIQLDSSDDENTNNNESYVTTKVAAGEIEDPERQVWMVMSPDGRKKGPFPLSALKRLITATSYALKIKVWKENQNEGDAISLQEAISLAFPAP